jgi:ATP-binding cassette subfamily F protein 3
MDLLSPREKRIRRVVLIFGSQSGAKTECGLNWLGRTIALDPAPTLVMFPTVRFAKRQIRQRLTPLFNDTPAVAAKQISTKSRDAANAMFLKEFQGDMLVSIIGGNGAGKSTFCRMITGQEEPSDGNFTLGMRVSVSYFSQNHADELDPNKTILETVEETATRDAAPHCRNLLGCFLFRGDDVFKKIGVLSGGERSRVALVRMLVQPANFLILDEPTNHLDMQSQDVLQRALIDYPGTVLIVSHNRNFLDPLVSKTLEFRPGAKPTHYPGNISYYLEKSAADRAREDKQKSQQKAQASAAPVLSKRLPEASASNPSANRKDQRKREAEIRNQRNKVLKPLQDDLEATEQKIAETEKAQAVLTQHLSSEEVASDAQKFRETTHALEKITQSLEVAFSRWGELTAAIEAAEAGLPKLTED